MAHVPMKHIASVTTLVAPQRPHAAPSPPGGTIEKIGDVVTDIVNTAFVLHPWLSNAST